MAHPGDSADALAGESAQGRRILLALVTGEAGERIQRWREQYDPLQAARYPAHVTLCYNVPRDAGGYALEAQVRHAFRDPVTVRLGGPRVFDNTGRTLYIEVLDTSALDRAHELLLDGTHSLLAGGHLWTWHVTCLRRSVDAPPGVLDLAEDALSIDAPWRIEEVACFELREAAYERIAAWRV